MNKSIREFLNSIDIDAIPKTIDWNSLLTEQKFFSVEFDAITLNNHYIEIHQWCKDTVGDSHYVWTGSKMWFETTEAALLFSIKWS